MEDKIDSQEIRLRAARGSRLLLGRQVIVQVTTFFGGVVIARILSPEEVGLFAIVSFITGIFGFLGDLGLGASLVQRKDAIKDEDLQIAFSLQIILLSIIVLPLLSLTPVIALLYPNIPEDFSQMIRVMFLSLLLSSWRSVSVIQMERQLIFDKLAIIETVEALFYQCAAVAFTVNGYGVWSLIWAFLLRGAAGAILAYLYAPWPFRLRLNVSEGRKLLRFGLPFQFQFIVNQLTSAVTPALAGMVAGPIAVGYLSWALSLATKPLMVVENISRVSFPMFSRLQHDKQGFYEALVRYLTWVNLINISWVAIISSSGYELVQIIYTDKWLGAVPSLILFSIAIPFHSIIWLVAVSLNAQARVGTVNWFMSLRAIGYWLLSLPLLFLMGYNGVAIANLIINALLLFLLLYQSGRKYLLLFVGNWWIFTAGFIACVFGMLVKKMVIHLFGGGTGFIAMSSIIATGSCYAVAICFFAPNWVRKEIMNFISHKKI